MLEIEGTPPIFSRTEEGKAASDIRANGYGRGFEEKKGRFVEITEKMSEGGGQKNGLRSHPESPNKVVQYVSAESLTHKSCGFGRHCSEWGHSAGETVWPRDGEARTGGKPWLTRGPGGSLRKGAPAAAEPGRERKASWRCGLEGTRGRARGEGQDTGKSQREICFPGGRGFRAPASLQRQEGSRPSLQGLPAPAYGGGSANTHAPVCHRPWAA